MQRRNKENNAATINQSQKFIEYEVFPDPLVCITWSCPLHIYVQQC